MKPKWRPRAVVAFLVLMVLAAGGCGGPRQLADTTYRPVVARPAYDPDTGPVVLIDQGHFNFHTADGRYLPFARALRADGYQVGRLDGEISATALSQADILVIANALAKQNRETWELPVSSAFGPEEIEILEGWVARGGALFLIADHMPFPGAAEDLAAAFGLQFHNGFVVMPETGVGAMVFDTDSGSLAHHPIIGGRNEAESVSQVTSFVGQAFTGDSRLQPLLHLPAEAETVLPTVAWEFDEDTPRIDSGEMVQGAVLEHVHGRVAVFGEAAMFSAQEVERNGQRKLMGMNAPGAAQNLQFLLNIMHWLDGLLPEDDAAATRAAGAR